MSKHKKIIERKTINGSAVKPQISNGTMKPSEKNSLINKQWVLN